MGFEQQIITERGRNTTKICLLANWPPTQHSYFSRTTMFLYYHKTLQKNGNG